MSTNRLLNRMSTLQELVPKHKRKDKIPSERGEVVHSMEELVKYLDKPDSLIRNAIIIEPDANVGVNDKGEGVRASTNVAYILREFCGYDSLIVPLWKTGMDPFDIDASVGSTGGGFEKLNFELAEKLQSNSRVLIFEGGRPSMYDPLSFIDLGNVMELETYIHFLMDILCTRRGANVPSIFICLSHQAVAIAEVKLIYEFLKDVYRKAKTLPKKVADDLLKVCAQIRETGKKVEVVRGGKTVATGYTDARFAVKAGKKHEVAYTELHSFNIKSMKGRVPDEVYKGYAKVAKRESGFIDDALAEMSKFKIAMFHGDSVNSEAIMFSSWAYSLIDKVTSKHMKVLKESSLSWVLGLPSGIEILASTHWEDGEDQDDVACSVATTAIYYHDHETNLTRRSFSCQFHPELLESLQDCEEPHPLPTQDELIKSDGLRVLLTMIWHGKDNTDDSDSKGTLRAAKKRTRPPFHTGVFNSRAGSVTPSTLTEAPQPFERHKEHR